MPLAGLPGHLEIRRELGAGGMGVVYEALDRERGEPVAVKLVTHLAADRLLRFRREFGAMARLRHPNIVRVYDFWEDRQGRPAYTMEIVRGGDLGRLQTRTRGPSRPEDRWRVAVEAILKLLRPLATLHRAGLVHRDLKPANVLLTEDGVVKLTDFGLVVPSGEPGRKGKIVGTPAYMAPEQIRGAEVDRRADLYSVGILLFEFLTGRRPFEAADVREVLRHQLATPAVRPSSVAPGLSGELDQIVLRALAKEPDTRYSSAEELADALEACLADRGSPSARAADQVPEASSAWRLFEPALAGRRHVLEAAEAADAASRRGQGHVLLVHGGAGTGKSRVLQEIVERLRLGGRRIVQVAAGGAGAGHLGSAGAVLQRLARRDGEDLQAEPAAAEALASAEPGSAHPLLAPLLAGGGIADLAESGRDRFPELAAAAWTLIAEAAAQEPLALVLDDAHRDGEASRRLWLDWIERTLRDAAPGQAAALLLILGADTDAAAASGFTGAVARSTRGRTAALDPLAPGEVAALLRSMLATDELPAGLADRVTSASAGHAGFAVEYMRWLSRQGYLRHHGSWRLSAPERGAGTEAVGRELFEAVLQAEIGALGPAERRFVQLLARLGGSAPFWLMSGLMAGKDATALAALDRLARSGIVREQQGDRIAFFHPSCGTLLEQTPAVELEPGIEARALEALLLHEAANGGAESEIKARLAEAAGRWILAASTHLGLGRVRARAGATHEAREHLASAVRCAQRAGDGAAQELEMLAELELGTLLARLGELEPAGRSLALAGRRAVESGDRAAQARALEQMGLLAARQGRLEEAEERHRQALELARSLGDGLREASVETNLGEVLFARGRLEEALARFEASAARFRAAGEAGDLAYTLNNVGVVQEGLGRFESALEAHRSALEAFRLAGDRYGEAMSLGNQATALHRQGRRAEALECFRASLQRRQALSDRAGSAAMLQNIGFVEQAAERPRAAAEALRQARSLHREAANAVGEAGCLATLSASLLALGRIPKARAAARTAYRLFQERGLEVGAEIAAWRRADVWYAQGRLRAAHRAFRRAAGRLARMGNRSAAAAAWLGLGRSSLALGREAQALLALRRARTEHRRLNQWGGAGEAAEALALAALRAGRLEEAEAWVRDARRAHRKGQSRAGQARVLSLAGALAALRGDLSAGARRVRRALGGLRVLERRLEAYVQLGRVGALSLMQGDLGKALRMLEQTRGRGARLRSLGLELSGQLGLVLALARSGFGELALQGLERCASMAGRCEDAWLARVVVAARREVSEASAGSGVARVEGEQASMLDAAEGLLLWA